MRSLQHLQTQLSSSDPVERRYAIEDLGENVSLSLLPNLVVALQDDNVGVAEAAAEAVKKFQALNVYPLVIPGLYSEDVAYRNLCIEILTDLGAGAEFMLLAELSTGNEDVKKFILDIYLGISDHSELPGELFHDFVKLTYHPNENIAGEAMRLLGRFPHFDPMPFLLARLDGTSPWIQCSAIEAIYLSLHRDYEALLHHIGEMSLQDDARAFLRLLEEGAYDEAQ